MIAPCTRISREERTECRNYRGTSLFSMVGKIYAGIMIERVCKVTDGLIDDDQEHNPLI